jgi:hypothetical protein
MPDQAELASEADNPPWVWLARIRKVQGRKGEVLAEILTDFPEKFAERKQVWLLSGAGAPGEAARQATLVNAWLHKGGHGGDMCSTLPVSTPSATPKNCAAWSSPYRAPRAFL